MCLLSQCPHYEWMIKFQQKTFFSLAHDEDNTLKFLIQIDKVSWTQFNEFQHERVTGDDYDGKKEKSLKKAWYNRKQSDNLRWNFSLSSFSFPIALSLPLFGFLLTLVMKSTQPYSTSSLNRAKGARHDIYYFNRAEERRTDVEMARVLGCTAHAEMKARKKAIRLNISSPNISRFSRIKRALGPLPRYRLTLSQKLLHHRQPHYLCIISLPYGVVEPSVAFSKYSCILVLAPTIFLFLLHRS